MPGRAEDSLRRATLVAGLVLVAAIAGLALYGLGAGGGFYHRLVRAPLAPATSAPYYRESLLHVGLAHALGLGGSVVGFRALLLALDWAALARFTAAALRRLTIGDALLVWLVAWTHPAAMIVHAWSGHPDAALLLLTSLLMFARRVVAVAALAGLCAWTNLPMAIVAVGSTAALWFGFAEPERGRRAVAAAAGLAVGALSCRLTLWFAGVQIGRDRFAAAASHAPAELLGYWTDAGAWAVAYTLHFAHALWLPALALVLARWRGAAAAAVVATQVAALAAAALAEDTTRVFACLAWAPLLFALIRGLSLGAGARGGRWLRGLVIAGTIVTLLAPKSFAWRGGLRDLEASRAHLRALMR